MDRGRFPRLISLLIRKRGRFLCRIYVDGRVRRTVASKVAWAIATGNGHAAWSKPETAGYSVVKEIMPGHVDFLVELRGFEPLASGADAPARRTVLRFPFYSRIAEGAHCTETVAQTIVMRSRREVSPLRTGRQCDIGY